MAVLDKKFYNGKNLIYAFNMQYFSTVYKFKDKISHLKFLAFK